MFKNYTSNAKVFITGIILIGCISFIALIYPMINGGHHQNNTQTFSPASELKQSSIQCVKLIDTVSDADLAGKLNFYSAPAMCVQKKGPGKWLIYTASPIRK
ncbi:hypothetical protein FH968_00695 [Buttiauxella sp. B2]|uniref:hypothetical protein n=1 Tax=Buttiauxella sp. B2 TaxID=2587812 RepID=UPI001124A0E7|nr:hypothetical protein [Buttiauxella sp. B2]TNV22608.1 hypothetical protein FH968_00695 [Buttiauxella sp. B2]